MNGLIPLDEFEAALAHLHSTTGSKAGVHTRDDINHEKDAILSTTGLSRRGSVHEDATHGRAKLAAPPPPHPAIIGPARLPPELIFQIALELSEEWRVAVPSWQASVWVDTESGSANEPSFTASPIGRSTTLRARKVLTTLISLSSLSTGLHKLIAPLVWEQIDISYPSRLPSLHALLNFYSHLHSSQCHQRLASPLSHVRQIHLSLPSQYTSVDQKSLVALLNGGLRSDLLQEFIFEAGEPPTGSLLRALLPRSERTKADKRVKALAAERIRSSGDGRNSGATAMIGHTGEIQIRVRSEMSDEVRQWEREARPGAYPALAVGSSMLEAATTDGATHLPSHALGLPDLSHDDCSAVRGLTALSLSCSIFWPGHALMSSFRNVKHLRLTSYEAHLLPQHLPAMLLALADPLQSLSMSTSKTAVLHVQELIDLGVWRGLQSLDVYAVTPEPPLAQALRSARKTLRHLRLTLDVSGAFGNYDRLWRDLTARRTPHHHSPGQRRAHDPEGQNNAEEQGLPALEVLQIDPFPQQHTSPSFPDFVRACPALRLINGRDANRLRLNGFELLDPDHYTGALAY